MLRTLIIFLMVFILISCKSKDEVIVRDDNKDHNNQKYNNTCKIYSGDSTTREPITLQYFTDFCNSSSQFSVTYFKYVMDSTEEHPDAERKGLYISSRVLVDENRNYTSRILSEINDFDSVYDDWSNNQVFETNLPKNYLLNIYQIINTGSSYYFNASEYGGEQSLGIGIEFAFGHRNYITMSIYLPDNDPEPGFPQTAKTFCKGWDPGNPPPTELMPLINYLESVVIPEMRLHPYGSGG